MTREEQILEANPYWKQDGYEYSGEFKFYTERYPNQIATESAFEFGASIGFDNGVKWSDSHPNWHKYPDEKPSKADEYIVAFDNGNVYTAHYTQHKDKWHDRDIANNCDTSNVSAWMEFPKPPKFD